MGLPRKAPKTSALLVSAIKKLRNIHGSTSREITNYIASECDGSPKNFKRQLKLALRRGVSAGVLRRSKKGYYTCAALDDGQTPGDSCRRKSGRRRSRRRGSCRGRGGGRRRRGRRSSRRRSRGRKRRGGRRGHRRRRGMKCGRKRRGRSRSRRGRRRRKCGGRRHEDGVELTDLALDKATRKQRPKRMKKKPKSKNSSKTSSQMIIGSASSGDTQGSGADTASLSASGKESFSDRSDISGTSDRSGGETKP